MKTLLWVSTIILMLLWQTVVAQTIQETDRSPEKLKKENLTKTDRLLWRKALQWSETCEKKFGGYDEEFAGLNFYPLRKDEYVVKVTCTLGAYQGDQELYLVQENQGQLQSQGLTFEQIYDDNKKSESHQKDNFYRFTDSLVWGTITFDGKKLHLINLNRFRGNGDCGTQTIYDVSKSSPKLIEFRAKIECDEKFIPPHQWKLYPLKQIAKWRKGTNPLRDK